MVAPSVCEFPPSPPPPQVCIERCAASQDLRGHMVMEHNLLGEGVVRGISYPRGVSPTLNPCKFFTPSLFILRLLAGWDTPHHHPLFSADASSPGIHPPCAVTATRWQHSPPAGWRFCTPSTPTLASQNHHSLDARRPDASPLKSVCGDLRAPQARSSSPTVHFQAVSPGARSPG